MMPDEMPFEDLEKVYDLVATSIDEVGRDKEALFLSKLCLVLAHDIGELAVVEEAIRIARKDIDA